MRSKAPALLPIFRSQHQADLLAWVLLHPEREHTLTELSRRLGVPLTTVQRDADLLVESGILRERRVGRARLLGAAPDSRYSHALTELVIQAFGPHLVVDEEFGEVANIVAMAIYGSWAARYHGETGPPPRDIDVLVIGAPDRTDIYEAADRIEHRIEIPVNPTICSQGRWDATADALIQQIKSSPIVWVGGEPHEESDALVAG